MNLLQGGSGENGQQTQAGAAAPPMAQVPEAAPAPEPTPQPVAPPPPPPVPAPAPQPVAAQVVPEPRPVTPDIKAAAPKKRGGAIIGVLIGLLLLGGAGIGAWWFLTQRNTEAPAPTPVVIEPVTPTDLTQLGGETEIEANGSTNQTTVKLKFKLVTSANSGAIIPEVELRPVGTAFTGEPTNTGQEVSATGSDLEVAVDSDTLTQGAYHWQARVTKDGESSEWAVYGDDPVAAAFNIDTSAPAAPTASTIGGTAVANPTVVTSNLPAIVGKAESNSKVTVEIAPEGTKLTATADANGNWTVTPTAQITNGQHELSVTAVDPAGNTSTPTKVALTVNPATAADTAPKPAETSTVTTPPAAAPQAPTTLAATGDNTKLITGLSAAVLILAAIGWMVIRRRNAFE